MKNTVQIELRHIQIDMLLPLVEALIEATNDGLTQFDDDDKLALDFLNAKLQLAHTQIKLKESL